jgi:hypothetical protein
MTTRLVMQAMRTRLECRTDLGVNRIASGCALPTSDSDIEIEGIKLNAEAHASDFHAA